MDNAAGLAHYPLVIDGGTLLLFVARGDPLPPKIETL